MLFVQKRNFPFLLYIVRKLFRIYDSSYDWNPFWNSNLFDVREYHILFLENIFKITIVRINFHELTQVVLTIANFVRPAPKRRKPYGWAGMSTSTC